MRILLCMSLLKIHPKSGLGFALPLSELYVNGYRYVEGLKW
jgi:hypothetical protein